jgi:hypothetical protein
MKTSPGQIIFTKKATECPYCGSPGCYKIKPDDKDVVQCWDCRNEFKVVEK